MQIDGQGISEMSYGPVCHESASNSISTINELHEDLLTEQSNLMAPDEFKNLGFAEDIRTEAIPNHAGGATAHKVRDDGKKIS